MARLHAVVLNIQVIVSDMSVEAVEADLIDGLAPKRTHTVIRLGKGISL